MIQRMNFVGFAAFCVCADASTTVRMDSAFIRLLCPSLLQLDNALSTVNFPAGAFRRIKWYSGWPNVEISIGRVA